MKRISILVALSFIACAGDSEDPCRIYGRVADWESGRCVCPEGSIAYDDRCEWPDGRVIYYACETDEDCSDGRFCTGVERCLPNDERANERGCVAGEHPCPASGCIDEEARCDDSCPDADGDGYPDAACGGTDCDDSDPLIHPGAMEICDAEGVDEDCDPTTLGHDRDGDGYVAAECCNWQPGGELLCGDDCDDTRRNVNPAAPEVCNEIDDDCDGLVDEGVTITFYRDRDGDSYGDPATTMEACSPPPGWTILCCDCNDEDPRFNPAATELCMPPGFDEDCDGAIDEGCDCTFMGSRTCGPGAPFAGVGVCRDGSQTCSTAGTLSECMGAVAPSPEVCDGLDNDCDGVIDEGDGRACAQNANVTGTTACGRAGVRRCGPTCEWVDDRFWAVDAEEASSCDYCADTAAGLAAEIPFATGTTLRDSATTGLGTATEMFSDTGSTVGWNINPATSNSEIGAVWTDEFTLGYGTMTIEGWVDAVVSGPASSRSGWAMSLVRAQDPVLGPHARFGAPSRRSGEFRGEWQHGHPSAGSPTPAMARFFFTSNDSDPGVMTRAFDTHDFVDHSSGDAGRTQWMTFEVTPDDPTTPRNETSIRMQFGAINYPFFQRTAPIYSFECVSCEGALCFCSWGTSSLTCPCTFTLRPGDRFRVALSASNDASQRVRHSSTQRPVSSDHSHFWPRVVRARSTCD